MAKTIKAQLKEIAEDGHLSEKQRAFVREQSAAMGVEFKERKGCGDCYRDQAIILWRLLCERDVPKSAKYVLRAGKDVIWKGKRVNATCTQDELRQLLAEGFPRDFFSKIAE